ncbi:MAG: hypothetical protein AAF267_20730 [Deinococcota bacterium]
MAWFIGLLYLLVIPYIGLMLMVVVGMFRLRKHPNNPETPSVSVIIPAHNEEDKLYGTLESLSKRGESITSLPTGPYVGSAMA